MNEKLTIFKSLFKGREDIYATRWEKGNKNGYSPAYTFDPYHYKAHRMKGGTFQNYENKQYQTLTDGQIIKHLEGEQLVGLYPLLKVAQTQLITDVHRLFIALLIVVNCF